MSSIIDRRLSGSRSNANRERLQRRVRGRLKEAVEKMGRAGAIESLSKGDKAVVIPANDLHEPSFRRDPSQGAWDRVLPGNKSFHRGDEIPKGGGGGQSGREGAPDGEGDDALGVLLSPDEFLDLLFDGLSLPNLRQGTGGEIEAEQWRRSGFVRDGSPSRMHVARTMRAARARRLALRAGKRRALEALQDERGLLLGEIAARKKQKCDVSIEEERLRDIDEQIAALQRKMRAVPFIDDSDLRFAHIDRHMQARSQAVMICVMDVSGSMGETEKDLSKRFFLLLYLFLQRQYQNVQIIFIKHHSVALECTEKEFFAAREGGGTLVSPALALAEEVMATRYPATDWNVYLAQASDGDNYFADNAVVEETASRLLQQLRAFYYLEVNRDDESHLLQVYQELAEIFPQMVCTRAQQREDVYPLFRELFSKPQVSEHV
ncbi:YeaH/YhbH family protein [Acidithiobacillus sp. IBUN Pt1247-S3]|uniref:YeaH/YhbH family protein n=1 Tax=Acidithiobacillus sp. IBUN Pt1247-S3 TaxID=3166642 RepID=UPI0034E5E3BB